MQKVVRGAFMRRVGGVSVAFLICFSFSVSGAEDPFIGTWKLDVANSKYEPPPVPYKSQIITIEPSGNIKVATVELTGKTTVVSFIPQEGKEVAVSGLENMTVTQRRLDSATIEHTYKASGNTMGVSKIVTSKEGKALEITSTGTNEKGRSWKWVELYNRQ
jgi:hypothetical protein